ncbi:MAG: hypothetical protein KDB80_10000 [Planctomycetes bacterium]|nr:hypothetical protein [Planctomycetota bacterium]
MTRANRTGAGLGWIVAVVASIGVHAQVPEIPPWRERPTEQKPKEERNQEFVQRFGFYRDQIDETSDGDLVEGVLAGGFVLRPDASIEVRGERGLIRYDRVDRKLWTDRVQDRKGLPTRGFASPPSRRAVDAEVLRARMNRFLSSMQRQPAAPVSNPSIDLELVRTFYLEGGVTFIHDDREVLRADRVWFSVVDDRAVFENVEMRLYRIDANERERVVVVRADRLVRQGERFSGRDISITTCDAGEPHFEIVSGEAEIIERPGEFEIRTRDNWIAFSGTSILPLPSATHYTGSPANYYVKGGHIGYSSEDGAELGIDFGAPMNEVGGAVHEFLTGRRADEFRGDWRLSAEWLQRRGFPLEAELNYRVEELYFGRTRYFFLNDHGDDRREIQGYIDGNAIDATTRTLVDTENRLYLNTHTTLDVTAFRASDPAVYSEFYSGPYLTSELPESTLHFRHARSNYSLQALGRWNLSDFSYAPNRYLAPRFVEIEPNVSFDLIAEEIAELPGDAPLLLTSSSSVGTFRSDYDPRFATPLQDRTTRVNQELELAVPFRLGDFGVRVFSGGSFTHFSDTVVGGADDRSSFVSGISAGTRLERTWRWTEGQTQHALRHVVSPTVEFSHQFKVDGEPADYWQFDSIDALDEGANVRVGVLQRFQRREQTKDAEEPSDIEEVLWIDLAQNFSPIAGRDNGGHRLGLGEFEVIYRPKATWIPVDDFAITTEGEHDWDRSELRTFNTYSTFGAIGMHWYAGYRSDRTERGVFQYGAGLPIRSRWSLSWGSQYDFARREVLNYSGVLVRRDHDWEILLALNYDNIVNETSFTVTFEPDFGGLFRRRHYDDLYGGFRTATY